MSPLPQRLLTIAGHYASEYKAVLLLGGVIVGLGLMIDRPPHSRQEMDTALKRVYSLEAQPVACKPERTPPSR